MAQSRKQRVLEEVKRKRQQRTIISLTIVAALIAIIGVGVWALAMNSGKGGNFPFNCLGQEYTSLHVHPWLRIYVNTGVSNSSVTIPAAVGILNPGYSGGAVSSGSCYEPMHTHDASGIIHIESQSTSDQYTLANFFDIWKVTCQIQSQDCALIQGVQRPIIFNQTDILGFTSGQGHTVSLIVDGQNYTSPNPEKLVMNNYDYCSSTNDQTNPCYLTANGPPNPPTYSTGHTLVIKYS